jgi:arylsulfatase A-like enzyme
MLKKIFLSTSTVAKFIAAVNVLLLIFLQKSYAQSHPNVLIIHTDEQSCWTIGAYGKGPYEKKLVTTPNLDQLAHEGALLTNHIANAAVCTPSRGQLLTGKYCHQNGASANWRPLNNGEITLAQQLKDEGYETAYIGKWHLSGNDTLNRQGPLFGFDDIKYMGIESKRAWEDNGKVFESNAIKNDSSYLVDFLMNKTEAFLKEDHQKPFFCMVSIHDPHMPFKTREPYASMFAKDSIPLPVNFYDRFPNWGIYDMDAKMYQTSVKQYLGMVKLIDDKVGEIVSVLKQKGLYDNTIIIFTSDHGDYMGQHGLYSKNEFYEEVYRIPFIIHYPKKIAKPIVLDQIISNVNVMPTILDMAGIKPNNNVQGESFLALLEGKKQTWTNEAVQLKGDKDAGFNKNTGIITNKYHLMLKQANGESSNLLFDREKDPFEQHNLYSLPQYADARRQLTQKIYEHYKKYNLNGQEWLLSLINSN